MSDQYYANITFPADALDIAVIKKLYRSLPPEYVREYDDVVVVANPQSNSGEVAMSVLLDQFQIPYDHYHRDTVNMDEHTVRVRFVDGEQVRTRVQDSDQAVRTYAEELLAVLTLDGVAAAQEKLEATIKNDGGPPVTVLAGDWSADSRYVFYSATEAGTNKGHGYWSNALGWVDMTEATVFTEHEMQAFVQQSEPMEETLWMTLRDAIEVHTAMSQALGQLRSTG